MVDLTADHGVPDLGDVGSIGPTDATWANGHLWFVSTRRCLPPGYPFSLACVRVTELATASSTIEQDFAINRSGYVSFGGGIGIAGDGSVVIAFSQGPGPCPCTDPWSTYATVQKPGDAANTIRPPQLIAAGKLICPGGSPCVALNTASLTSLPVVPDPIAVGATWQASVIPDGNGWQVEATRLSDNVLTAPNGTFSLAGGRTATNALRLGIELMPDGGSVTTQALLSNSPATTGGVLDASMSVPMDLRTQWSLADPDHGGSTATGDRTVYVQWGDGRGNWSPSRVM